MQTNHSDPLTAFAIMRHPEQSFRAASKIIAAYCMDSRSDINLMKVLIVLQCSVDAAVTAVKYLELPAPYATQSIPPSI